MEQYSIIHTVLSQFVASYLDGVGNIPSIKLLPDDDALMPQINRRTFEVSYSYRTEILILLQNCNCDKLLLDYYFAVVCYINNNFEDSKFFLKRLVGRISEEALVITKEFPSVKDKVIYQLLFMILHEVGHGLFKVSEEDKYFFYKLVEDDVKSIANYYQQYKPSCLLRILLQLFLLVQKRNMKSIFTFLKKKQGKNSIIDEETYETIKDFPSYITSPYKKEELACDLFALRMFQYIMEQLGIEKQEYIDYYSACLNAIQFFSRYMWWESFFIKQYSLERYAVKTYLDPLRIVFFFEECRAAESATPILDKLYEQGMTHIPALKLENDGKYFMELGDRRHSISTGVIQIDKKEKLETMELLLAVENKILYCVSE